MSKRPNLLLGFFTGEEGALEYLRAIVVKEAVDYLEDGCYDSCYPLVRALIRSEEIESGKLAFSNRYGIKPISRVLKEENV